MIPVGKNRDATRFVAAMSLGPSTEDEYAIKRLVLEKIDLDRGFEAVERMENWCGGSLLPTSALPIWAI